MKSHFLLIVFCIPFIGFSQTIHTQDFEAWNDNDEYTKSKWTSDGFSVSWVDGFNQARAVIDNSYAYDGNNSLRVAYPAGGVGTSQTGVQAPLAFNGRDEVWITYALRFSDTFSWGGSSQGGKLPGLGSGNNCSGGDSCSGTNGFSARLMWRSGGRAVLYLYHMDKPEKWGEDMQLSHTDGTDVVFTPGEWYQVTERVRINSGNTKDGTVTVWINNEEALHVTNLQFVNNGDKIDNLYFSTFHGGSGSQWAPSVDSYIWYDAITISESSLLPQESSSSLVQSSAQSSALESSEAQSSSWQGVSSMLNSSGSLSSSQSSSNLSSVETIVSSTTLSSVETIVSSTTLSSQVSFLSSSVIMSSMEPSSSLLSSSDGLANLESSSDTTNDTFERTDSTITALYSHPLSKSRVTYQVTSSGYITLPVEKAMSYTITVFDFNGQERGTFSHTALGSGEISLNQSSFGNSFPTATPVVVRIVRE